MLKQLALDLFGEVLFFPQMTVRKKCDQCQAVVEVPFAQDWCVVCEKGMVSEHWNKERRFVTLGGKILKTSLNRCDSSHSGISVRLQYELFALGTNFGIRKEAPKNVKGIFFGKK